jgi:hypothetical protein
MAKGSHLKKITARAKQIRKKRDIEWTTAVKMASKEYNSGKLSGSKKTSSRKKVSGFMKKRNKSGGPVEVAKKSAGAGLTIAAATHFIVKEYEAKLGRLEVRLFNASTKTEKKKIRSDIAEVKRALNRLQK